jgi:hypothetical protein
MKKIIVFLLFFVIVSCTTSSDNPELPQNRINNVEIILTTTEPNTDEIQITYYDIAAGNNISNAHKFIYDNNGNPLPIKLVFNDYKYKFLDGEAFRNNFSTAELRVQVFVNGELLIERARTGSSNTFATVDISFRIIK